MAAGKLNLTIEQGTDFEIAVTLRDPTTKVPLDLTGYSFEAQIRTDPQATSVLEDFTISVPIPTNGEVLLSIANADTSLLPANKTVYYDLEATKPDSKKFRVIEGTIFISPEVTR